MNKHNSKLYIDKAQKDIGGRGNNEIKLENIELINKSFKLYKKDIDSFNEKGFVVLEKFISENFINYAQEYVRQNIVKPNTNYGSTFNKLKYDIGNDDEIFLKLIQNDIFQKTMLSLTKRYLIFTQGLSFELEKNKDKGFPWHVGTVSFACQKQDELGYTMWIPFCKINPKKQRGGMKLLSQKKLSGEFIFQYINLLPERLEYLKKSKENNINFDYFYSLKNDIINQDKIAELLDYYSEEPLFEIGDVVIFNKYVLHRSVPLEDGELNSRLALALRFIDIDSTYDKSRVLAQEFTKKHFNYSGSSDFSINVAKKDGDLLMDSILFKKNLNKRIVGYNVV